MELTQLIPYGVARFTSDVAKRKLATDFPPVAQALGSIEDKAQKVYDMSEQLSSVQITDNNWWRIGELHVKMLDRALHLQGDLKHVQGVSERVYPKSVYGTICRIAKDIDTNYLLPVIGNMCEYQNKMTEDLTRGKHES